MQVAVRHSIPLLVGVAAQPQYQPSHGIRRAPAITEELTPILVARYGLVLLESADQIGKELLGQIVFLNGGFERHKYGMQDAALIHGFQFVAPPAEEPEAFGAVANLVA